MLLGIFYPKVGSVAALFGAFTTMLVIYILPCVTYMKQMHTQIQNPILAAAITNNKFKP